MVARGRAAYGSRAVPAHVELYGSRHDLFKSWGRRGRAELNITKPHLKIKIDPGCVEARQGRVAPRVDFDFEVGPGVVPKVTDQCLSVFI